MHVVYCALKLTLPRLAKRQLPNRLRQPLIVPDRLNEIRAFDCMADPLYGGRAFRTLNVNDEGKRECLWIEVASSIPSLRIINVLGQLNPNYGHPKALRVDNGAELTATAFTEWCELRRNPQPIYRHMTMRMCLLDNASKWFSPRHPTGLTW